jgi:hypothetical protein
VAGLWQTVISPDNAAEIQALQADRGSYLGYVRLVGRRRADARLDEPIVSIPSEYAKKPLLRNSARVPDGRTDARNP